MGTIRDCKRGKNLPHQSKMCVGEACSVQQERKRSGALSVCVGVPQQYKLMFTVMIATTLEKLLFSHPKLHI